MTALQNAVKQAIRLQHTDDRYDSRDAVRAMVPKVEVKPTWGKKQIVAAHVAAMLGSRLDNIQVRSALDDIQRSDSWRSAEAPLSVLGDAGVVLSHGSLCCAVPCAPCAIPGAWTNWGLPNTQEVARRLLDWE
jgi:hypothetical protein